MVPRQVIEEEEKVPIIVQQDDLSELRRAPRMNFIDYDHQEFDEYVAEIHGPQSEVHEGNKGNKSKLIETHQEDVLVFNFGYKSSPQNEESQSNEDNEIRIIHDSFKPGVDESNMRDEICSWPHLVINDDSNFKRRLPRHIVI